MRAEFHKYILNFKRPSGTSRGVMTIKETWFITIRDQDRMGVGECGMLRGLSFDDVPDYELKLAWACDNINKEQEVLYKELRNYPSIIFGLEQAFLSFTSENPFVLFPSQFTASENALPINGLIWMGDLEYMKVQVAEKLEAGYRCLKFKIGALDFDQEYRLLASQRETYSKEQLEIRVDANGAFSFEEAPEKLKMLSHLDLHSIEQPIKAGQIEEMAELCQKTPLPIALDEELIPIRARVKKIELLDRINPQFIILKPSLLGGYKAAEEWIELAEERSIGWWVTSALESNIGLNAIAQWTASLGTLMPQGLGTGLLFTNNIESPLRIEKGALHYDTKREWNTNQINQYVYRTRI